MSSQTQVAAKRAYNLKKNSNTAKTSDLCPCFQSVAKIKKAGTMFLCERPVCCRVCWIRVTGFLLSAYDKDGVRKWPKRLHSKKPEFCLYRPESFKSWWRRAIGVVPHLVFCSEWLVGHQHEENTGLRYSQ